MTVLQRTSLFELYKSYGGKVIDFGGWELPVQFLSIKEEHEAVRTRAGLFDVSHMGEFEVKGEQSLPYLQRMMTNDVSKLSDGQAQYTAMCYEDGGTVDDLLVYRRRENDYLLVVNASNIDKDFDWMTSHVTDGVQLTNISNAVGQLALQGPLSEKVLQKLTDTDLSKIGFFRFEENVDLDGMKALVSRTGYTGEDGFEIYLDEKDAPKLWEKILEAGEPEGILPCGLGARDTLRFEARLALYGQELTKDITPIEAGIGFVVKTDKDIPFIGQDVLARQKAEGAPRKLVGIEMIDKGIPRTHYEVLKNGEKIGEVTTGTQSPTLKKNLGLALIKADFAELGTEVDVQIRQKTLKAVVVKAPFYKKG
ncbi:glycine cleavage system aminomethyltransferase GcvT [Fictibacillus iocasae]|uniref:Aminomethyltransferase n=1 Tax=Fictibacillus iocasae TaxID=2715437 RepID=A0ABW2NMJ0_9BACL